MSEVILQPQELLQSNQQAKEWTPAKVIYTSLMAFNLMSFIWLLATGSGIDMPPIIQIARIITAALAIYLGKLWRDRGFQILLIYSLLFFFRVFIPNPENIFHVEFSESVISALWLFAGCYGLGRVLKPEEIKRFLAVCVCIWATCICVLCCLGIYAVWTEKEVVLWGESTLTTIGSRLSMIYISTVTGAIIYITILISVINLLSMKNRAVRVYYVILLIPMVIALALTDTRTAFISLSTGFSILATSLFFHRRTTKISQHKVKEAMLCLAIMLLVFSITLACIMCTAPLYNKIKEQGFISRAIAEEINESTISSRGFEGARVWSGRAELRIQSIGYLRNHPLALLIGESKIWPLRNVDRDFAHIHCLYLQVLLESGIPGLLLLLFFVFYIVFRSYFVMRDETVSLWIKLLPAIPISLLVGELAECHTWLRASQCPMSAILFITSGIISCHYMKKSN